MEGYPGGLDLSETSLQHDFPVILAASRKPVESSYSSGDFSNLCFIPQRWCILSKHSSSKMSSPGDGHGHYSLGMSGSTLAKTTRGMEQCVSNVDSHTIKTTNVVTATDHRGMKEQQAAPDRKDLVGASAEERSKRAGTFSYTFVSEVQARQASDKARSRGDKVIQPPVDINAQQAERIIEKRTENQEETTAYTIQECAQEGVEDYIPCLFYRWPLSDTLLLHFHGLDEDLGKTAVYLERLHQRLKVNILAMEYPGYGICSELPRNSEGTSKFECTSQAGLSSHQAPPCSHVGEVFASERPQEAVLPRNRLCQKAMHSLDMTGEQQAEKASISAPSFFTERICAGPREHFCLVEGRNRDSRASAPKESSEQNAPFAAANHRRTAASFRQLLHFVLTRLKVAPQCIFLSAMKMAAGPLIELCQYADRLLGADLSFGGIILLQPLFVFPSSPYRNESLSTAVAHEEKTACPGQSLRGSEAENYTGIGDDDPSNTVRTRNSLVEPFVLHVKGETIPVRETDTTKAKLDGCMRAYEAADKIDGVIHTRPSDSISHPQVVWPAQEKMEELCITSSLDTTVECLRGCLQKENIAKTGAQRDSSGAAERKPSLHQRRRDPAGEHSPARSSSGDSEQYPLFYESRNAAEYVNEDVSPVPLSPHGGGNSFVGLLSSVPRRDDSGLHAGSGASAYETSPPEPSESHDCGETHAGSAALHLLQTDAAAASLVPTEAECTENSASASSPRVHNVSLNEKVEADAPAKSLFEYISSFLLPSFLLVPQDEPEEGGRVAAIAEAALQHSRRNKLERRRRITATLEDLFGMKQALQRASAIKCPILLVAHCAVHPSRIAEARETRPCRPSGGSSEEDIAWDSSSTALSRSDSDNSVRLSESDVLETLSRMLGKYGSFSEGSRAAGLTPEEGSIPTGIRDTCRTAGAVGHEAQWSGGVPAPNVTSENAEPTGLPVHVQVGEALQKTADLSKQAATAIAASLKAELFSDFEQDLINGKDNVGVFEEKQQNRLSGSSGLLRVREKITGTRPAAPKQRTRRCLHGKKGLNTDCIDTRLAEDMMVDRSIALLMAHANSSAKNEVFTTVDLDTGFFTRIKQFIESCRKMDKGRLQAQQLASLRASTEQSPKKELLEGCCDRTSSSQSLNNQSLTGKDFPNSVFLDRARWSGNAYSRSRPVRIGGQKTVSIPLELFFVPLAYKRREEVLSKLYAKETLDDDDEADSVRFERTWFHKTLEVCAEKLNLLAAVERAV